MSRVRITGGIARGRVLREPISKGVRPTAAKVREALFSMVGQQLDGVSVLDAFGGSGLVGLEAWSRGATVTVVERDARTHRALVTRGKEVDAQWRVIRGNVLSHAEHLGTFDWVFADPPYSMDPLGVFAALGPLAVSWFVYEADEAVECPDQAGSLTLDRVRHYGKTTLWLYR